MDLAASALAGDRRALARLLSRVENGDPEGQAALMKLFPHSGQAHIIGITGAPGAGKSTLLNRLAHVFREHEERVAVVAVDPTSPYSGGALLGDRLRMRDLVEDPGIFIRSMASRGHPGGVAHATRDVVTVLDAVGVPVILVETVGAGQSQVEVARVAHTVVLVEAPGMGDAIQALKAGLMEIADIIVVNKADRPEARQTVRALQSVRRGGPAGHHGPSAGEDTTGAEADEAGWEVPILKTSALEGEGIAELMAAILAHREDLKATGRWDERLARHARAEIEVWVEHHFHALLQAQLPAERITAAVEAVSRRQQDPVSAARSLLADLLEAVRQEAS
ncbi:MAG: methylmalonyl Co-A mutase-associated GTPase MeaB [Anaerolineales bacterium]